MADEVPTPEELMRWYTPEQARQRADRVLGEGNGGAGVWNRMRGGLIRTFASSASIQTGYTTPVPNPSPILIPFSIWRLQDNPPPKLWVGELDYFEMRGHEPPDYPSMYVSAFGIRLDPADMDREFPEPMAAIAPEASEREAERGPHTETADEPLQKLTAEEFEKWARAVETYNRVFMKLATHNGAVSAFAQRLKSGLLRAGAENHSFTGSDDPPGGVIEIEREHWPESEDLAEDYNFWRSGTLSVDYDGRFDSLTFFGVRFEPSGLAKMMVALGIKSPAPSVQSTPPVAPPTPSTPQTPAAKHAGGRPREPWWDDLWAEIGRQLYARELQPKQQKDIEIAMTTWAENHGHHPAVSTIRLRAQKLAKLLRIKVEN
jgi:hypothetical protein